MTVAPTTKLAITIDVGAAVIASVGLVKASKESVQLGIAAAAFLYFFSSFIANYASAPV